MLTEAEVDEVMRLRAKGFGAWDDADLDAVVDLTWQRPHVLGWLTHSPLDQAAAAT